MPSTIVQFGVVILALELTGYTQDEIGILVLKAAVPFKNLAGSAMIALNRACESKSAKDGYMFVNKNINNCERQDSNRPM